MDAAKKQNAAVVRVPLEFLDGHHARQGVICAALEQLATEPAAARAAETAQLVLDYLDNEMPLHIADEEEDLFPLLLQRCGEDDELEAKFAMLRGEHEADDILLQRLQMPLREIAGHAVPVAPEVFARDAIAFATLQRRHLAWENGTILPLARQRLTAEDHSELARRMTARRQESSISE